jgi:23S rRNA pseudouridine955/2504/2580 synthase
MKIAENDIPFEIPLDRECNVIDFHSSGIWAIEKASGILSHPNRNSENKRVLLHSSYDFEQEKYHWIDATGKEREFYLVHRLDSATSGVILGVSNIVVAEKLKAAFLNRDVKKTYFAIVAYNGRPIRPIWKDFLQKNPAKGKIRVTSGKTGDSAITSVSMKRKISTRFGNFALLELKPKTGRTHQLRVQCANRRLPIIGDRTYGNFELNRKFARATKVQRICLHASKISFSLTVNGECIQWEVEAAMPRAFARLLY